MRYSTMNMRVSALLFVLFVVLQQVNSKQNELSRTAKKQCSEQDCITCKTAKEIGVTDPSHCGGVCTKCQYCAHAKTDLDKYLCNTYCKDGSGGYSQSSCFTKCQAGAKVCLSCECDKCNCNMEGSTSEICNEETKHCYCKTRYITGWKCDTCHPGFMEFPKCNWCWCNRKGSNGLTCNNESGQCNCKDNIGGKKCDNCVDGRFKFPACQECKCHKEGSNGIKCNGNGQCSCNPNVTGLKCEKCSTGYKNYPKCDTCDTNFHGYPKCICKPRLAGVKCERCTLGYKNHPNCDACNTNFYGYPNCQPCGCNDKGSKSLDCDKKTGLCQCKANIMGDKCDRCIEGFVGFPNCKTSSFESLRKSYCNMELDEKRNLLLSSSVTAEEAEKLLASSRPSCKAEKFLFCKHSSEEILDFPDRSRLEAKIESQCKGVCQDVRKTVDGDLSTMEKGATQIFTQEEEKSSKTIAVLDNMANGFAKLSAGMVDKATLAGVNKLNADFQNQIQNSNLDEKDKNELKTAANEAARKEPKRFKTIVETKIMSKQSKVTAQKDKVKARKAAFKANMKKVKTGMKSVGSAGNVAKASRALSRGASGISKFMSAKNPDGSLDEKKIIGGVLDVVDSLATFLPAPASIVTGTISSIVGMFMGGGGPSTQEVIQDGFKKQKKFIEEQFAKQEKLFKNLMTQTELESVKAKGLGVLDALQSRYDFIEAYEDLGTCLKDNVVGEITERVEYFMDQSDAASIKHTFDTYCPHLLSQREASDSQQVCGFLLYTYLVIEEKRHEILTLMISLLANTEDFEELMYGYLNVQSKQKRTLEEWMMKTFGVTETYCGLFVYHKSIWNGKQTQMEYAKDSLSHFVPELWDKASQCIKIDCFLNGYDIDGGDIGTTTTTRDANNCQIECSRNFKCNYWSYAKSTKKCWLKREVMGLKKSSNVQSGPKKCLNKEETEEIDFRYWTCTQSGVDLGGGDILSSYYIGGKNEKSCRYECQKNSKCVMFTLYNDRCYLKSKWEDFRSGKGSAYRSGLAWCPASVDTCALQNEDFLGDNLYPKSNIQSVLQCQLECQKVLNCWYYSYDKSSKKCWLKDEIGSVNRNMNGVVSGWQSCACGQYGAEIRSAPYSTTKNVGNIELCYKLCKSTSSCVAWNYNLNNFVCKMYSKHGRYEAKPYNTNSNAIITGPKHCLKI